MASFPSYFLFYTAEVPGTSRQSEGIVNPTGTKYSTKMAPNQLAQNGFTVITTGTLTGTLTFWTSDKDQPDESNDNDWQQDTTVLLTNPAGAATATPVSLANIKKRWARVKYVHTSGSGTLKGYANA